MRGRERRMAEDEQIKWTGKKYDRKRQEKLTCAVNFTTITS
jgi:hypothetical protein